MHQSSGAKQAEAAAPLASKAETVEIRAAVLRAKGQRFAEMLLREDSAKLLGDAHDCINWAQGLLGAYTEGRARKWRFNIV
eukprot:CAMPEP_0196662982 /NCGR_PEP_ID=MMETSP1086-20130531/51112_1 /TAXON_ID=77921 /ORGANISM="Cyanoptyche  gloeocystis , Strain SAG4.97" /LENGTH=80 /DNA_ID=CAMNT_0041998625 /DNA_START=432 /DNA_END=675 /DNA_ORIENTATION=+